MDSTDQDWKVDCSDDENYGLTYNEVVNTLFFWLLTKSSTNTVLAIEHNVTFVCILVSTIRSRCFDRGSTFRIFCKQRFTPYHLGMGLPRSSKSYE